MASFSILVVDDDELSLEILALTLSAEGHRVLKASSGEAAMEILSQPALNAVPDVILTDFQMPGVSGPELCHLVRQLQATDAGKQPLLIGMSATAPSAQELREFDGFVTKPLDARAFHDLLIKRLTIHSQAAPGPSASENEDFDDRPALDPVIVQKLRKLMPGNALDELYAAYLSDTRARLVQMENLAAAGDAAAVRRTAHMIKGSAGMTGATAIAWAAALLETGNLAVDEQRTLFDKLRCACDAIEGTLARDARNKEAHDHQTR